MLPVNYISSAIGGSIPLVNDPRLRKSVFVGDLSFFCTEIDLANAFSRFGHVVTVEIKRGRHGDSLLHGFVEFDNDASAELSIHHMNGRKWMGRTLRVNWTNISVAVNPEQDSWIQVHVNFTCKDLSRKINEEFLEAIFVPFGGLADVTVKRHGCTGHPLQTTGYGFAYFKETFSALRAVHALRVIVVDGVRIECSLSRKAEATISQSMGVMSTKIPLTSSSTGKPPSPTLSGLSMNSHSDNNRKIIPSSTATYPQVYANQSVNLQSTHSNFYQGDHNSNANNNRLLALQHQQMQQQNLAMASLILEQQRLLRQQQQHQQQQFFNEQNLGDELLRGNVHSVNGSNQFFMKSSASDDATDSEYSFSKGLQLSGPNSLPIPALEQNVQNSLLSVHSNPYSLF